MQMPRSVMGSGGKPNRTRVTVGFDVKFFHKAEVEPLSNNRRASHSRNYPVRLLAMRAIHQDQTQPLGRWLAASAQPSAYSTNPPQAAGKSRRTRKAVSGPTAQACKPTSTACARIRLCRRRFHCSSPGRGTLRAPQRSLSRPLCRVDPSST